jgi:hypothetical protein
MAKTSPHQPLLLCLLHGAMVVLVPLAWLSGAVVFSNHDGRWLRLPLQVPGNWIDIHGTIGVLLWPLAALFVIYALSVGRFRLRHGSNAAALIGLVLAVGSGKFMEEDWLRNRELDHFIYHLHVLAWLLIAAAVAWHIAGVFSRGGVPLASSMFRLRSVKGSSK